MDVRVLRKQIQQILVLVDNLSMVGGALPWYASSTWKERATQHLISGPRV